MDAQFVRLFSGLKLPVLFTSLAFSCAIGAATVDIEQRPLLVNEPLPPNIVFVLDDSYSMNQDDMPDDTNCSHYSRDYDRVISYSSGRLNRLSRERCESSDYNKIYFNPNVDYPPPVNAEGDSFPDSDFYNAKIDGFDVYASGLTDLSKWIQEEIREETTTYQYGWDRTGYYCRVSPSEGECPNGSLRYDRYSGWNQRWWQVVEEVVSYRDKPFRYFSFDRNNSGCNGSHTDDDCYDEHFVDLNDHEMMQQVANWYSYYRTRIMLAKTGVSIAFDELNKDYRIGYGSLNKSGSGTIVSKVGEFESKRSEFYGWLLDKHTRSGGTPLRRALGDIGEYYSSNHPYQIDPSSNGGELLSCRQNFTILMTDGYWNSSSASESGARSENDNAAGEVIEGPGGLTYQYSPVYPFRFSENNNLADVAMYYWKNDLRPSLTNDVPASVKDPAFWQHMVTIGIGLGVTGQVDKTTAFNAIESQAFIDWDPDNSNEKKIDDLLHASVNSRGNFFSAQNPAEFVSGLEASLAEIASRVGSGSALAASSSQLQSGSTIYNASYRSGDWSGNLSAYALDESTGGVTTLRWNASIPAYNNRSIYSSKVAAGGGSAGVLVSNVSDLDAGVQGAITSGLPGTAAAQDLLNYLRGDQSKEEQNSGGFRNRVNGLLGDIVHSTPVFVGAPDEARYKYTDWPESSSHATFASAQAGRSNMLYVNSNDGMMHGFLAENASANKGREVFAFMPRSALMNGLSEIADPDYNKNHRYFLDGPVVAQDVFINGAWHTVLVGTTGRAGATANNQTGKSVFAIDITDPSSMGAGSVLWEVSHDDIGQVTSAPVIARLDDGEWYVVFGNGYNSANDRAAIIKIKLDDGSLSSIPGTSASTPNGLAGPLVWDLDEDGSADTAYAGDLYGNVYKFDLLNGTSEVIFVARDSGNNRQPITAGMTGTEDENGDTWIHFGTGKYFSIADMSNRDGQTWYGIRAEDTTASTTRNDLRERTINSSSALGDYSARVVSEATTGDMSGMLGWYLDFDAADAPGERMVLPGQIRGDALVGYTIIPISDACNPGGDGYVMVVDPFTGARLDRIYFDFNGDGEFNSGDQVGGVSPSGLSVGRIPSSGVFVGDDLHFNTDNAISERIATNPGTGGGASERISWREIME